MQIQHKIREGVITATAKTAALRTRIERLAQARKAIGLGYNEVRLGVLSADEFDAVWMALDVYPKAQFSDGILIWYVNGNLDGVAIHAQQVGIERCCYGACHPGEGHADDCENYDGAPGDGADAWSGGFAENH